MLLRGIENHRQFIINLGFAAPTARKMLRKQVQKLDLENLERFCLALKCTPNDLLEWQPPQNQSDAEAQALAKLTHGTDDLTKLLATLPLEKVQEITDALRRKETE